MSQPATDLLRGLQRSWPAWLPPALGPSGPPAAGHPLAPEVTALLEGQASSLPFFPGTPPEVAWVTVASDADRLAAALADLRAWILPSLGWEDARGTVVTGAGGTLGAPLLVLSPGGYLRWRSRADARVVEEILRRLTQARELAGAIPRHALTPVPALIELRQHLAAALAAGDRIAAEEVLATLNRLRLDTAQNALLTQIRVLDHFGDARQLVEMPELDQLLRVRLPQNARAAIARAFHRHYLAPHESSADLDDAKAAYAAEVVPRIGPLLDGLRPEICVEVLRLLAYRAADAGSGGRERIGGATADPIVAILLPPVSDTPPPVPPSYEEQFFAAWQTQDWAEVQRLGLALLPDRLDIVPVLRRSLERLPNPELRDSLAAAPPAIGTPPSPRVPQSWGEWLAAIATADVAELERFLDARLTAERLPLSLTEGREITEQLTDQVTAPTGHLGHARQNVLLTGVAELAGDSLRAPDFPSPGFLELYRSIARCWGEWKRGSAYPPDGQLLLEIADGILQHAPADEGWLAEQVMLWWDDRPSRALLPFMLGAVELFHRLVGATPAERFWIGVGNFVRFQGVPLALGERILWRQVGADIGYDGPILDEYVPMPTALGAEQDPLATAGLKKIAVVSTREEQANRAADQLRKRTGAEVLVVSGTVGSHETDSAASADVVAFVWSATTHAVFRAFDKVDRKKFAYVRGTGTASIVLAVERWVMECVG